MCELGADQEKEETSLDVRVTVMVDHAHRTPENVLGAVPGAIYLREAALVGCKVGRQKAHQLVEVLSCSNVPLRNDSKSGDTVISHADHAQMDG